MKNFFFEILLAIAGLVGNLSVLMMNVCMTLMNILIKFV